ncbi:MAG: putative Ig domain-containing protein [Sulfuritalea sp.]|nr:putative Ig domain-containing protein [Sulfuritalea sp.]
MANTAPTFTAGYGKLTTDFGGKGDAGYSLAVQADGKFVVAGRTDSGSNYDIAVARYNADGSLDTSFSGDGRLTTAIGAGDDSGMGVAIQADGKVVVAGYSYNGSNNDFAVVRYNVDGSLDTSFSGDGKLTRAVGSGYDMASRVTILADGKILVAGATQNGSNYDFALVRYNPDGTLDIGFDGDGTLTAASSPGNYTGEHVAVQADGKILVADRSYNGSNNDFALTRYNTDGSLDAGFGVAGKVTTAVGLRDDVGHAVALQADGKILVAGSTWVATNPDDFYFNTDVALLRYNADGSLDSTFGSGGIATVDVRSFRAEDAFSIRVLDDGRILVAGTSDSGFPADFALARFSADGSLDTSFGSAYSLGGAVSFTTLGAAVVLDSSVTIADAELDALNDGAGNYAGATVTLARHGGARSDDAFSFVTSGASFTVSGNNLLADGQTFGTWSQFNGTLSIAFTSSATVATNALVDNVLEHISYRNMSFAPPTSVQIDWTLTDSQMLAGTPLTDAPRSVTGSTTVNITAISHSNSAPDLSTLPPGIVTTPIGASRDQAHGIALQADGKVLAAGYSYNGSDYDFALVRYNADGSVDTSFSGDGKLTTAIGASNDYGYSVAVQPDGKILLAGQSYSGSSGSYASIASIEGSSSPIWTIGLVRYNPDGSLDTTFSSDGKLTTTFGSNNTYGQSVVVQDDGKILVAGSTGGNFALLRYNADGSFDTSFDADGGLTTDIGFGSSDYGKAVAVQADGGILVAGSSNGDLALARYNSNGSLDTNFSGDGRLSTAIGAGDDQGQCLVLQADGKIIVAGSSSNGSDDDFAVVRYNLDGSLDAGFGGDGMVTTAIGSASDSASSIALQADGKIVVAGSSWNGSDYDVALVRYHSDGSLDASFSDDGMLSTDVGGVSDYGYSVVVQADGKIVVTGQSYKASSPYSDSDFVVIRYNIDGSLDTTFESTPTTDAARLFHAGGAPIRLDSSVVFSDLELDALNAGAGDYAGASVTLARFGGASADDVFGFDLSASSISIAGNQLLSAGQAFATFNQSGGQLAISLDSSETVATHALLLEALEHITYQNTNLVPPAEVRIEWTLNDGNTGGQGLGVAISTSGSSVVAVSAAEYSPCVARLIADQAAIEGSVFSLVLPVDTFVDGDAGDMLTYSASLPNGAALPAWLSFDPATRSFSGTPMLGDLGSISVQVSVADQHGHTASEIFHIDVALTTIQGSDWHNLLTGGIADEAIIGLAGNDTLDGAAGSDRLDGGDGKDVLIGGSGGDILTGGADTDIFRYTATIDSTAAAMDVITDFAGGDTLDFVGMQGIIRQPSAYMYQTDVATTLAGIQADASISNSMVFFDDGSSGYLYIKGSGSGVDYDGSLIQLTGHVATLGPHETGLNVAPTISGTSALADIAEDSVPAGIRVSSLLAGSDFADVDSGDLQGIAVIAAGVSSAGAWAYSTDGTTWAWILDTTDTQALLLDANSQIRFQPVLNTSGTTSLTLRAWDQTSGTATTHDLPQFGNSMINGGTAAFSSGTHTLQLTVAPANDAPVIHLGATKVSTYSGPGYAGAQSIGIQSDGKIVLAGGEDDGYQTDNADFVVARFDFDGSLDASFGVDGKVTTGIRSGADSARDVAIQPDGKIVVAGYGEEANGNDSDIVVVRYNADGSLDTSFSGDGKLVTDLGSTQDTGSSVAVQGDGKILVGGSVRAGFMAIGNDFALVRYNPDGTLDTGFNGGGVATASFMEGKYFRATDIAILGDGKILVAGSEGISALGQFAMARFNADGSLDTSFSGDGKLTTDFASGYSYASVLAVQADGKMLLAGQSGVQLALVRYNSDGSLDTEFGGDGIVSTAFQSMFSIAVKSIVVQNDGKILVSGYSSILGIFSFPLASEPTEIAPGVTIPTGQNPAVLVRYNTDGTLDTGFGSGGILVAHAGGVAEVQPDGKILLAGGDGFALARYNSDGTVDSSFGIPTYREQGAPVILDRTARVSDLELDATGNYAGASLSLSRNGGADARDAFSASGNLGALTPGGALTLSGTVIGAVGANAGGLLIITFDANATQARVNETLSSIAYANTGDTPPASVQIDWTFSDGNTGDQGSGGAQVASGSTLVNIVAGNNIPVGIVGVGGTATQGHILIATDNLADTDGLGIISYQWQSSLDGILWNNADSGPTLTLTATLVGQQIRAVASYTDGNGTMESIASLATSKVAGYQSGTLDNDSLLGTAYADILLGLAGNDRLVGGGGNDRLDGGRGADQMEGGNGNDLYVVDQRFDQITELADSGIDSVSAKVGHVLADHVENLYLTGSVTLRGGGFFSRKTTTIDLNIDGTGNASDNLLRGYRGHNQLDGLGGNDTQLGGAGADVQNGGTGADRLLGGAGADSFVFAAGDGGPTLAAADLLYDFEDGIDRIALTGGLDFADLSISQGNGIDTATGNTVIGTGSGEYLVVLLHTSASAITGVDFQVLA